ncbi:hypothetical protein QEP66_23540 [Streptomyces sp. LB8]|uniref:hypothetical protein n=1 Tax=Streptomyces sp. LB8 TaxID=3042509 RepID=UPI00264A1BEC|nr:hypothetical protein [Streptomyces sp. LB8]MDN5385014.1 hypothetical protein [Streptomyces sp. LB8]
MTNELTPSDIVHLIEAEVQKHVQAIQKDTGQLTREDLNGMTWQEIAQAKASGRLDNILLGREAR